MTFFCIIFYIKKKKIDFISSFVLLVLVTSAQVKSKRTKEKNEMKQKLEVF